MAERLATWEARSAWRGVLAAPPQISETHGVTVKTRDNIGLATIIARGGQEDRLQATLATSYAVDLPARPVLAHGRGLDLVWAGPAQWLAVSDDRAIAARLAGELAGIAAVSDQSDGRAALRLSGPKLRDTLAKGCPIDLHPRAFRPGDTAITAIAHIGVQFWQVDEASTFDILVARSMAGSFWTWFSAAASEFGIEVR